MSIVVPNQLPRARGRISSALGKWILNILGWKITGVMPNTPKVIFAVAPHTSNWDFVIAVAAMLQFNLKVTFLGKAEIFVWPFNILLRKIGGVPVKRNASHGVVGQIVQRFNESQQMILGLAPEGTRSKTRQWKTGFLQIANQANVPVVPVSLDFKLKEIQFYAAQYITDDIDSELVRIKQIYQHACAKNPQAV